MKGRYQRSIVILLATVAVALILAPMLRSREPVYQGKSVHIWLRQLKLPPRAGDPAAMALLELGPEAVPYLARHVGGPKTIFDKIHEWLWSRLPPVLRTKMPSPDDAAVHANAAWALGRMGPDARATAVPALRTALNDPQQIVRFCAAEALGKLGDESREAVDALTASLRSDPDSAVRWQAAKALGRLGAAARSALPALSGELNRNDWRSQHMVAEAILAISPEEEQPGVFRTLRERGWSTYQLLDLQTRAKMATIAKNMERAYMEAAKEINPEAVDKVAKPGAK